MAKKSDSPPKPHHNIVLVAGIWITVVTASIWAGGYLISRIAQFLPYSLGVGIVVLSLGLLVESRGKKSTHQTDTESS